MERINLLDNELSNKIAAGEVVERPASVVKELLENSIDAGAKRIEIEIEEGGEALIRVSDDGAGIHPDDIEKAFLPHATSKISTLEDLFKIMTMGFRGEALPSIAAIARVKLSSKQAGSISGKEIVIEGGNVINISDAAINKGTFIEVRDLFYNVPARKKFLKSTARETALIGDIINRMAMAYPDIAFTFINNGKQQFSSYGNGNVLDTIRKIYGRSIETNLIRFESHGDILSAYGYIGNSEISRGSRNNQTIFVNKRLIKSKLITAAVENAFKSFATINKFPFFLIYLDIYPDMIDVNIHPSKAEIKFKDERYIFKFVFDAVHNAMRESLKESFMLPEEREEEHAEKAESLKFDFSTLTQKPSYENVGTLYNERVEHINEASKEEVKEKQIVELPIDLKTPTLNIPVEEDSKEKEEVIKPTFPDIRIIGQFNKTYIIGEYDKTLYLVDQHAAHEKIMFERYMDQIMQHNVVIQPSLIPLVLELDSDDYAYYEENKIIFSEAGFTIEEFGDNTIIIKEMPYVIGRSNHKNVFLAILDNLKNMGTGSTVEYKYDTIARMACRSAVKANEELTIEEMRTLLMDLSSCREPFHCPHGRPTILQLSLYEMEKLFKRIQ